MTFSEKKLWPMSLEDYAKMEGLEGLQGIRDKYFIQAVHEFGAARFDYMSCINNGFREKVPRSAEIVLEYQVSLGEINDHLRVISYWARGYALIHRDSVVGGSEK